LVDLHEVLTVLFYAQSFLLTEFSFKEVNFWEHMLLVAPKFISEQELEFSFHSLLLIHASPLLLVLIRREIILRILIYIYILRWIEYLK
jgi:hypothetical protein